MASQRNYYAAVWPYGRATTQRSDGRYVPCRDIYAFRTRRRRDAWVRGYNDRRCRGNSVVTVERRRDLESADLEAVRYMRVSCGYPEWVPEDIRPGIGGLHGLPSRVLMSQGI